MLPQPAQNMQSGRTGRKAPAVLPPGLLSFCGHRLILLKQVSENVSDGDLAAPLGVLVVLVFFHFPQ